MLNVCWLDGVSHSNQGLSLTVHHGPQLTAKGLSYHYNSDLRRQNKMRRTIFARILWVSVALLVSVVLSGQIALGKETDISLTVINMSVLPFLSFAPIFIDIEEGYFAEQGIEVEMVKFKSSSDALPALAQGQLDVVAGSISASFFNAVARGLNIKAVADKGHIEPEDKSMALVVREKLYQSGELRSIGDLQGKRLALTGRGTKMEHSLELILAYHGLTLQDVEPVYLDHTTTVEALKTGAIDVAGLTEPRLTRVVSEGFGVVLAYYGVLYQYVAFPSQSAALFFGPNLLDDQPDLARKFILAYLEGVRAYNQGKTPSNLEILSQYTKLDRELLIKCGWPHIYSDGHLEASGLMVFQQWLYQNGFVDEMISVEDIVDTRFTD